MLKNTLKKIVPDSVKAKLKAVEKQRIQKAVAALPKISEEDFVNIMQNEVGVKSGDVTFIHSSIDRLNLDFPFYRIISLMREIVGESGTILFPTYPKLTSYKFLKSGQVFNVKRTASFTGILNEFARRQKDAVRSLHPTKSVVALGKHAKELTAEHQNSPYPYDRNSPYYKITEYDGIIVGIGINTSHLSFVHCIDDTMKEKFPVQPYHDELFEAECINYEGESIIVKSYAHDMDKMHFDIPKFVDKYISEDIARNIDIDGMKFGRAESVPLFARMTELAEDGITIFKKQFYKK